jgi:hypothetical protein
MKLGFVQPHSKRSRRGKDCTWLWWVWQRSPLGISGFLRGDDRRESGRDWLRKGDYRTPTGLSIAL